MVDGQLNQHCILLCIGFEFIIFNVILKNLNNQNVNLIWQIYKISFNNFKEYKCTKFSVISLRINELQKKYGCRLFYRGHCSCVKKKTLTFGVPLLYIHSVYVCFSRTTSSVIHVMLQHSNEIPWPQITMQQSLSSFHKLFRCGKRRSD